MRKPTAPTFDAEGYPTEDTLERLRNWPSEDINGALDFVVAAWSSVGSVSYDLSAAELALVDAHALDLDSGRYLRLATGGWSGNEDLIAALDAGGGMFLWVLSVRGGLHIYRYLKMKDAS